MIRRAVVLTALSALFIWMLWGFYTDAIRYHPLDQYAQKIEMKTTAEEEMAKAAGAWTAAIHEKNLFSPNRSYLEPQIQAAEAPPPPPPPEVALKGIVLDRFGEFVAYVEINKAKAVPMRKGDTVEGLAVVSIAERELVLKWNAETIPLRMDKIRTIQNPKAGR